MAECHTCINILLIECECKSGGYSNDPPLNYFETNCGWSFEGEK
jgi:hypothetical protein